MGTAIFYKGTRYPTGSGGGGGGSSVIPNPSGTPTDTLETIEIDGDIYEIQGGGGSGNAVINPKYLSTEKLYEAGGVTTWADTNSYTATQPCIAYIDYYGDGATNMMPILNGNRLAPMAINKDNYKHLTVFLKSGDTIGKRVETGESGSPYFYMTIYAYEIEGSGGGSSVNYSTSEQVIGTWIDGKPLYQICKSFTVNRSARHDFNFTEGNAKMVNGYITNSLNNISFPLNATWDSLTENFLFDETHFYVKTTNNIGDNSTLFLVVQYTKSTD